MAKIMNLVDSRMLERVRPPVNPLHRALSVLDSDMKSILERADMSDEEKVQAYNQTLQKYLEYQRPDVKAVEISRQQNKPKVDVEQDVMRTIPKSMRGKALSLIDRIKENPETSWNDRGEFVYRGQVVSGTNMVDLINDVLRHRKTFNPRGRYDFARALRDSHVPQEMIGNSQVWNWMHRETATSDAFSTAGEDVTDEEGSGDDDNEPRRGRSMMKTPAKIRTSKKPIKKINWETPK